MEYKKELMEIIDGIRPDFDVLGDFAFGGSGDVLQVNERFWRVYDAALKARELVEKEYPKELADLGFDWAEMEGFRQVVSNAGPPAAFANASLFGDYTMRLNSFFIFAQQLDRE